MEAKQVMDRVEKWEERWWSGTMDSCWAADGGLGSEGDERLVNLGTVWFGPTVLQTGPKNDTNGLYFWPTKSARVSGSNQLNLWIEWFDPLPSSRLSDPGRHPGSLPPVAELPPTASPPPPPPRLPRRRSK